MKSRGAVARSHPGKKQPSIQRTARPNLSGRAVFSCSLENIADSQAPDYNQAGCFRTVAPPLFDLESPQAAYSEHPEALPSIAPRPQRILREKAPLQQLQRNPRTRLGIRERMVMVRQIVPAGCGDRMQLVIGQLAAKCTPRRPAGAMKRISGIRHPVELEYGPQTPLVERCIVRHQRQPLDPRPHLLPNRLEIGCIGRIGTRQTVNRRRKAAVIVGTRTNQPVNPIDDLPLAHDHDTHRANARSAAVGRFEIYGCKIFHMSQTGCSPEKKRGGIRPAKPPRH